MSLRGVFFIICSEEDLIHRQSGIAIESEISITNPTVGSVDSISYMNTINNSTLNPFNFATSSLISNQFSYDHNPFDDAPPLNHFNITSSRSVDESDSEFAYYRPPSSNVCNDMNSLSSKRVTVRNKKYIILWRLAYF